MQNDACIVWQTEAIKFTCTKCLCLKFFITLASSRNLVGDIAPAFSFLTATCVVLFQTPAQTSPKWPVPSFLVKRRDSLGISQTSLARPFVNGLSLGQGVFRAHTNPSASYWTNSCKLEKGAPLVIK